MTEIKNLNCMSTETSTRPITATIAMTLAYYLQLTWEGLTKNKLEMLEHRKATYLKRVLYLFDSKFTPSWLIQILAKVTFPIKTTQDPVPTDSYKSQETNF
jgi:hypothetical protein